MQALTRLETLRQLILEGNRQLQWFGAVGIQKAAYLLEAVYGIDLGYPYGLHHLGPYSPELTEDLQLGEQVGLWISQDSGSETSGRHYNVSLAEWPEEVVEDVSRQWHQIETPVKAALQNLHDLGIDSARALELVGTIHYLEHVQEVPPEDIPDMLRLLKPKYTASDIKSGEKLLTDLEAAAAGIEIPKPEPAPVELHLKLVPPMDPEPEPVVVEVPAEEKPKPRGRQKVAVQPAANLSLFEGL